MSTWNKEYNARAILLIWDVKELGSMNEFITWRLIRDDAIARGKFVAMRSIYQCNSGFNPELDTIMQAVDRV